MKTIYVSILFLILTSCGSTSTVPLEYTYEKIIEAPDLSKDQIYIKANAWFVERFNSAESVIEFQDKSEGRLIGKYSSKSQFSDEQFRTIISVDIKENKARIKFYDARFYYHPYNRWLKVEGMGQTMRGKSKMIRAITKDLMPSWKWMADDLESKLNKKDDW